MRILIIFTRCCFSSIMFTLNDVQGFSHFESTFQSWKPFPLRSLITNRQYLSINQTLVKAYSSK